MSSPAAPEGLVWQGLRDETMARVLPVLKVDRNSAHAGAGERRLEELLQLGTLNHPNLRALLKGVKGSSAIAFEPFGGATLEEMLAEETPAGGGMHKELRAHVRHAKSILEGLAWAHDQGATHGGVSAACVRFIGKRNPVLSNWWTAGRRWDDAEGDEFRAAANEDLREMGAVLFRILTGSRLDAGDEAAVRAALDELERRPLPRCWLDAGRSLLTCDDRAAAAAALGGLRIDEPLPPPVPVARYAVLALGVAVTLFALQFWLLSSWGAAVTGSREALELWLSWIVVAFVLAPGLAFHLLLFQGIRRGYRPSLRATRVLNSIAGLWAVALFLFYMAAFRKFRPGLGALLLIGAMALAYLLWRRFVWARRMAGPSKRQGVLKRVLWSPAEWWLALCVILASVPLVDNLWQESPEPDRYDRRSYRYRDRREFRRTSSIERARNKNVTAPWLTLALPLLVAAAAVWRQGRSYDLEGKFGDTFFEGEPPDLGARSAASDSIFLMPFRGAFEQSKRRPS